MKNKKAISMFLFFSIIVLIAVASFYGSSRLEKYMNPSDIPNNPSPDPQGSNDKVYEINSFSEFNRYVNSQKGMFIVFGKENCSFCSQYRPVLSQISNTYNVEIAYLNMTNLSEDDYFNVMNTDLTIPAKCVKEGRDIKLKEGFGTPLSLFVREGAVYDCIRGYNDYETSEILLRTIGYIK